MDRFGLYLFIASLKSPARLSAVLDSNLSMSQASLDFDRAMLAVCGGSEKIQSKPLS